MTWKDVLGYEDFYSVSDNGEIFSKRKNIILKYGINNKGYKVVSLFKNGKGTTTLVHRIVASTFLKKNKWIKSSKPH